MEKKDWTIVIVPLLITWILDQVTKQWATGISGVISYNYLHFVLHHNHGAMLGLFSDLPAVLRVVSLSTGGAFLLCLYALIQYLLPIKSLTLRTGLSILIGGIIGNVTDRIRWGYIVDFIVLGTPNLASPAFNVADALQWVGYGMIVYAIIKEGDKLWPEYNSRKSYWVNISFQLKYSFILTGIGLALGIITLVFSYTYLRVTIAELIGNDLNLLNRFLNPFIFTFVIITVAFCAALFAIGRLISHRIAGPIYAFEKFLEETLEGKDRALKLRSGDEFHHLEVIAEKIRQRMKLIRNERTVQVVEFEDDPSKKTIVTFDE